MRAARQVRRKVLAALPPGLRDASERAGQRFHLDAPGWFDDPEPPPLLARLAEAVWQDQTLTMRYRRGARRLRHVAEAVALASAAAEEPDADGWVRMVLPVESLDVAYTYLIQLGPEVEVLEPASLRARLAEAADRTRDLYR